MSSRPRQEQRSESDMEALCASVHKHTERLPGRCWQKYSARRPGSVVVLAHLLVCAGTTSRCYHGFDKLIRSARRPLFTSARPNHRSRLPIPDQATIRRAYSFSTTMNVLEYLKSVRRITSRSQCAALPLVYTGTPQPMRSTLTTCYLRRYRSNTHKILLCQSRGGIDIYTCHHLVPQGPQHQRASILGRTRRVSSCN